MSEDTFRVQYSFKTPAGTLVNVRGKDIFDLKANLENALNDDIVTLFQQAEGLYAAASNVGTTPPASQQAAPQAQQQQQYQQQAPAPQVGGHPRDTVKQGGAPVPPGPRPSCQHGDRFWNSFQSRQGKQIKQWLCPLDSGDYKNPTPGQCDTEWAR